MGFTTEIFRRVYDDEEGWCIQVGPDLDDIDLIEITAPDAISRQRFGDLSIVLPREMAEELGAILIAAATE